ncbi:TPA: hypothetical protein ACHQHX_006045 [Pseudomonas aeruginosa]
MAMIDLNLDDYPTLRRAAASRANIRIAIGPAGSAKTTWCIKELMTRSILQPPGADGVRYTKWLVVRQTYQQLRSTTLESFRRILGGMVHFREHPTPYGHSRFDLPDGTQVDVTFEFLSMDSPDSLAKLLGYEPTGAFLDEVSELSEMVIESVDGRCGRFPSGDKGEPAWVGVIGATNGPNKGHWLFQWSTTGKEEWEQYERETGRPYFELFQQPPALLRPEREGEPWLPNPDAENIQYLPDGYAYYFKQLGRPEEHIKAYIEGQFSDLRTGKVVFTEFNYSLHRIPSSAVEVPRGAPLLLSFDFGRTPVCLIAIAAAHGRLIVIGEIVGEDISISGLYNEDIKPVLKQKYPDSKPKHAWGDPAGKDEGQAVDLSPFAVLRAEGIPIEADWPSGNRLEPRIEAVRRRLRTLARDGQPLLLITDACPLLLDAVASGYVYESVAGHQGVYKEVPTKSHVNWVSDLADALEYLCLGFDTEYATTGKDERVKTSSEQQKRRGRLIGRRRA